MPARLRKPISPTSVSLVTQLEDRVSSIRQFAVTSSFEEAGRLAYPQAAQTVEYNSPPGKPLEKTLQNMLSPFFKEFKMHQVRIHWNAFLVDRWKALGKEIMLEWEETHAQSYGYDVYFEASPNQLRDEEFLPLLFHHLEHIRQYVKLGESLENFGGQYFMQYENAGKLYAQNLMEQDAIIIAEKLRRSLRFVVSIQNNTPDTLMFNFSWANIDISQWLPQQLLKEKKVILTSARSSSFQISFPCGEQTCRGTLTTRPFLGEGQPGSENAEQYVFRLSDGILNLEMAENVQSPAPIVLLKK